MEWFLHTRKVIGPFNNIILKWSIPICQSHKVKMFIICQEGGGPWNPWNPSRHQVTNEWLYQICLSELPVELTWVGSNGYWIWRNGKTVFLKIFVDEFTPKWSCLSIGISEALAKDLPMWRSLVSGFVVWKVGRNKELWRKAVEIYGKWLRSKLSMRSDPGAICCN